MPQAIAKTITQILIPLVATTILSSCASVGLDDGLGRALPPQNDTSRLPPYDPFGSSEKAADAMVSKEGQNTVSKSQRAAVTAPASPRAPALAIDGVGLSPFAGMTADALRAQWGAPSLMRTEAGSQLWQYQGKNCVVLAYLYPNASGGMETAFAEAHPGGDSASAVTNCLGKSALPREADAGSHLRKPEIVVRPD
jgi:hypothetical protein